MTSLIMRDLTRHRPVIFHTELLLKEFTSEQRKNGDLSIPSEFTGLVSSYPLASGRSWIIGRVTWPLGAMHSAEDKGLQKAVHAVN